MNKINVKTTLPLSLCCAFTIICSSLLNESLTAKELPQKLFSRSILDNSKSYQKQQSTLEEKTTDYCQSIGTEYQEFYNFETLNYKIGICYKSEKWFYYRQSKSNPNNSLFLPAKVVFGGDFFRAQHKKVTYFVGVNSNGYYSSVMYGNNQIVFEPELSTTPMITKNKENVIPVEEFVPKTVVSPDSELDSNTDNFESID